jgi:energy-coupling factor transport system ATP-binding protein
MANNTAKKNIIEVEHLRYVYNPGVPGESVALDDVSFTVEEGDFVGIIGATGSGKSTLIAHMNGLNRPTSGTIRIDGRDMWADPGKIRDFRFMTGLVFQYPEYQLFEETCYKDIAFGPKNMGLDDAEIDRRVHEAARFVGLDESLLERSPFELSGGQKRRVAVAGVMAMEPRILVLDEPAAGLDPEGRDTILAQVKEYHKKTGTTVLLVSHSMEDIAKYANKVLVLAEHKIAMYDTVEHVFDRAPELLSLGLSVPQVTKIFIKLREMGLDVPADVYTVPYAVKVILAAKARRDAGESLLRPRQPAETSAAAVPEAGTKGGAATC